jgi:hypothetical protein
MIWLDAMNLRFDQGPPANSARSGNKVDEIRVVFWPTTIRQHRTNIVVTKISKGVRGRLLQLTPQFGELGVAMKSAG